MNISAPLSSDHHNHVSVRCACIPPSRHACSGVGGNHLARIQTRGDCVRWNVRGYAEGTHPTCFFIKKNKQADCVTYPLYGEPYVGLTLDVMVLSDATSTCNVDCKIRHHTRTQIVMHTVIGRSCWVMNIICILCVSLQM